MAWYFRDNFFSAGVTAIENEHGEPMGELDLRSAFGSSLEVRDAEARVRCSGAFRFFTNRWAVEGTNGEEWGVLRHRMAFFSKKYEYDAYGRGLFTIESPAFSRAYEIFDEGGNAVASFDQINGWFSSGAFRLDNISGQLDDYELVAVVMGMHQIQKRQRAASNNAAT